MKYEGKKNGKHIIKNNGVYIALTHGQLYEMLKLISDILSLKTNIEPEGFKPADPIAYYQDIEDMKSPLKDVKSKNDLKGE